MRAIDDYELAREWMAYFGNTGGVRLLGWCALTAMRIPAGQTGADVLLRHGWGSQSTRYANVAKLRGFKDYLTAKGLYVAEEADEPVARVVRVVAA